MADNRNMESARDLYRKAKEAHYTAPHLTTYSIGGSNGTITETFGHRVQGLPTTFTHVNHPQTGWSTFVGDGTPEIEAARRSATRAKAMGVKSKDGYTEESKPVKNTPPRGE